MPTGAIVRLRPEHLNSLATLLESNGLPIADGTEPGGVFYGVFDAGELIGAGGLETVSDYALLRSVVVHPHCRGRGLARRISGFLLGQARSRGSVAVYLLTETAAEYFEQLGFRRVARGRVPPAIAATAQFTTHCPHSAQCLMIELPRA